MTAVLIVGQFVVRDLAGKVEEQSLSALAKDADTTLSLLKDRIATRTDPVEVFQFGQRLVKKGEFELAIPVLERAVVLAPEEPTIEYLYAWTLAATLDTVHLGINVRRTRLETAQTAAHYAATLDPLNPDVQKLITYLKDYPLEEQQ